MGGAEEGVWELGKDEDVPRFYVNPGRAQKVLVGEDPAAVQNLIGLLQLGFVVQTTVKRHTANSCLILRSFSRALEATAVEQEGFDELLHNRNKKEYIDDFFSKVPYSQRQPILRTCWAGHSGPLVRPVARINYAGKTYQITDPVKPLAPKAAGQPLDNSGTWNRDVYRLIIALNSQVTVDISKFQRQVLQLQQ